MSRGRCSKCGADGHYAPTCDLARRGRKKCCSCLRALPFSSFHYASRGRLKNGKQRVGWHSRCKRCKKLAEGRGRGLDGLPIRVPVRFQAPR